MPSVQFTDIHNSIASNKVIIEKAKKVLLDNKKNGFTLPTNNKLYPAQWNWDSGFIALGYSYFNITKFLSNIFKVDLYSLTIRY